VCGPIDEGVDCLAAAVRCRISTNRDLFRRPSLGEPISHEQTQSGFSFEDRFTPPAQLIGSGGVKRRRPPEGSAFRGDLKRRLPQRTFEAATDLKRIRSVRRVSASASPHCTVIGLATRWIMIIESCSVIVPTEK
jgi:hypothetical protein